jgi:hypothetical protein
MPTLWIFMKSIRFFSAALLVASVCLVSGPALAADPVFAPGTRVGLTPLVGLVPAKTFAGFETEDHGVKVLVTELPAEAYGEVSKAFKSDPPATAGIHPATIETAAGTAYYTTENAMNGTVSVRRYSMILPGGTFSGYIAVEVPENSTKIYTDDAVRQMFASAVVRKAVPIQETLGHLPFKVGDIADFKNVRLLPVGAAVVLSDNEDESAPLEKSAFMIVGLIGSAPAQPEDRDRFAQEMARSIPGIREVRLTVSEPIRIDSTPGYETRLEGVSGKDNVPVTVVQWLRFGNPAVMRIIGIAPRDQWEKTFPRFRAVRDGIQARQ